MFVMFAYFGKAEDVVLHCGVSKANTTSEERAEAASKACHDRSERMNRTEGRNNRVRTGKASGTEVAMLILYYKVERRKESAPAISHGLSSRIKRAEGRDKHVGFEISLTN